MHDDITELKRDIGLDCGDHSCRYAVVRTGMRTNGGCRCEPPAKQIADLTRRLEAAQRSYDALSATRDAIYAKLAAVEQERDTMRTALLALPVVVKELEQALDVLDDYYDGAEDSSIKWLGEPMYYVRNAKERLAQGMRER